MRLAPLALAGALLATPAAARDIPDEADFLLWCGSAIHFMAVTAESEDAVRDFLLASEILTDAALGVLFAAQVPEEDLIGLIEHYDERVIADLESGELSYESDVCINAVMEGLASRMAPQDGQSQ